MLHILSNHFKLRITSFNSLSKYLIKTIGLHNFSLEKKKGLHNFISKPNRESLTVIIRDLGKACFGKKNIKNLIFFYTKILSSQKECVIMIRLRH